LNAYQDSINLVNYTIVFFCLTNSHGLSAGIVDEGSKYTKTVWFPMTLVNIVQYTEPQKTQYSTQKYGWWNQNIHFHIQC